MSLPPHDLDAERAVLAAVLLGGPVSPDDVPELRAEQFFSGSHAVVYAAVTTLHARGHPVDLVTVAGELRAAGKLDAVGGLAYLTEILDAAPAVLPDALRAYARAVRRADVLRKGLFFSRQMTAEIEIGVTDSSSFLNEKESALHMLAGDDETETMSTMPVLMKSDVEDARQRAARGCVVAGVQTGLYALDEILGGLHGGDLTIVAARPGVGKSSLAMQVATHVVKGSRGAVVFNLEMTGKQLARRALCAEARVNMQRARTGTFTPQDWAQLIPAASKLYSLPHYYVDDRASATVSYIRSKTRHVQSMMRRAGVEMGVVVIDYLQLVTCPGTKTRELEIAAIARAFKILAKELLVPVMALSQLNRGPEARSDKRPTMSDLRESGAIEQDADNIVMMYRDDYHNPRSPDKGVCELIICKQRNGPTGVVKVGFEPMFTTFHTLAEVG